ncbi:hypothetical protein ENKNEFLB_04259 [Nocardioides aquaticus]|uniref:FAD-binding FR-type domain-containing protein n=1 Tax=Nocardioides aquaticus TaxID=160826 RepID=A0ABX8EPU2_9ACTN|nr:siderophore-interacting protein [Nocardioides aquaticus]QVT81841.1 hypothetical protein ENKNEFLB_04259 [Nocardioides aquaticus]
MTTDPGTTDPGTTDPGMTEPAELPLVLGEVEVASVDRLSPSFVRVELGGACLAEMDVDGSWLDQRFKVIFPCDDGSLPQLPMAGATWWEAWQALPEEERGSMRTYTVRDVRGLGEHRRLVVDIVVHEHVDGEPDGPGNRWASAAAEGDRLLVLVPRRGHEFGGREFAPAPTDRVLLVADETAVPAVAGILRDLGPDAAGCALLEVPTSADVQALEGPAGVEVHWLPRDGAARGDLLHAATVARLGVDPRELPEVDDDEVDPNVWETPVYSSSGEQIAPDPGADVREGLYAWIAGESKVVTGLRRHLVRERGVDRGQVAFMGYWREGVSMRG